MWFHWGSSWTCGGLRWTLSWHHLANHSLEGAIWHSRCSFSPRDPQVDQYQWISCQHTGPYWLR
jgi:hypothetical protein